VVADALHAAITGRSITRAEAPGPLAVRGTPAELAALVGQEVRAIRQRGKFLSLDLERDAIVCNPMLTGRFQLAASSAVKARRKRRSSRVRPADSGADGRRRLDPRRGLAAGRRRSSRDPLPRPDQMGKVYLQPAGIDRPVPGSVRASRDRMPTTQR
jgi:formamidopyrimidine-DNA glycosylase